MSFECFDTWPCFFDPSWCVTSCSNVFGHLRDHSWWSPRGSLQHADISPSKVPELPSWIKSPWPYSTKLPACVWWSRRTAYLRAKRFLNVVRSYSCSGILYTEEYYTTTTTTRQRTLQGALEQRLVFWLVVYAVLLCLNLWSSSSLHQLGTSWPIRHDKSERIPQPNRLPCIIFCVFVLCFGV